MFELNLMLAQKPTADLCPVDVPGMQRFCEQTLEQQQLMDLSEAQQIALSIEMLDKQAMRALNRQYRQKDHATNVLSFASDMPVLHEPGSQSVLMLGDIVFCPEIIESETVQQGKSAKQHWAHLLVHGTLHLCGYDHVDSDEAVCMEELEIQILSLFGIANPYQIQSVL